MNTCQSLQNLGYKVQLLSDTFRPYEVELAYGLDPILDKCERVRLPDFRPELKRLSSFGAILYSRTSRRFLENLDTDVTFVTQAPSWPVVLPNRNVFRFVYEIDQMRNFWESYRWSLRWVWRVLVGNNLSGTTLLALGPSVLRDLQRGGFRNSILMPPAYGIPFRPRPKKKQVVYVTFLAPQKRIDDFIEIARALPQYKFVLLCRDTQTMNEIYKGYAKRILAEVPDNLQYVESRVRQAPEFLEESKVYLHTSSEPGMGIAVMEALSAGCVPVVPSQGGASEILSITRLGFLYDRIEESVNFVKSEMEGDEQFAQDKWPRLTPEEIAERARIFSPESFQERIAQLIENHTFSRGKAPS